MHHKKKLCLKIVCIILGLLLFILIGSGFATRGYTKVWTQEDLGITSIADKEYPEQTIYSVTTFQGLEAGDYTLTVAYEVEEDGNFVDAISYYGRQNSEIEIERCYLETDSTQSTFHFSVKENVDDFSLRFSYGGHGALTLNGAMIDRQKGFTDFYYTFLALGILAGIIVWQLKTHAGMRLEYFLVWAGIGIVSMPLLKEGIALGWDMIFHVNRVEGIYEALISGDFPVRVQAAQFGGYGYATSIFYPDLFLYIPAMFRILGMSLSAANELFIFLIQIAVAWIMFYSTKRIFGDITTASMSSIFYLFATYRVFNVYANYAMGANLAAVFLPLVVLGIYELTLGNGKAWATLVLGCTGVLQSHILTTVLVAVFGGIAIILAVPRILKEKRIVPFFKAGIVIVILNIWFLIPFVQFQQYGLTGGLIIDKMSGVALERLLGWDRIQRLLGNAAPLELMSYRYNIILVVLIGVGITVFSVVKRKETPKFIKGALVIMLFAVAIVGEWFPWEGLSANKWIGYLQFPVRICMIIEVLASMIAAYGFSGFRKYSKIIMLLASCWCVVSFADIAIDYYETEPFMIAGETVNTYLPQEEYIFADTDKNGLITGKITANTMSYQNYEKQGTRISMDIENATESDQLLEVPLLYYPGYAAELNGVRLPVSMGNNNVVRICIPQDSVGVLKIWYRGFGIWYIGNLISLIGWIIFLGRYVYSVWKSPRKVNDIERFV